MTKLNLYVLTSLLFLIFSLSGCGEMKKMMDKTENIQKSLMSHCDCDDVKMISYNMENFTTTAQYEVVGANFKLPEEEAQRLKYFLEKEINDFCDIDQFVIDFINKGKHQYVTISKCEIVK